MRMIALLGLTLLLAGCSAHAHPHGSSAKVRVDGVGEVELRDGSHKHGGPAHCPPGHRKKQWC